MESHAPEKSTTIDDLPNELLTIIFEQLKIRDLTQCSLVCRRFKLICSQVKISELIITNKIENINDLWFYTNKQFNHQDAIDVTTFFRYRSIFRLDKLKRLYFKGKKTEYTQLDVNSLTQVEQIRIDIEGPSVDDFQLYVHLPNLRIAEIHHYYDRTRFHITAPKLEMLKYDRIRDIHLVYPDSITYLDVRNYTKADKVLSNVQFVQIPYDDISAVKRISVLPNLKTISCYNSHCRNRISSTTCLLNIFMQKRYFRRFDLKIYIECVEVDSTQTIDELFRYRTPLSFQISHYNSLRENIVGVAIDYNELMRLVAGEIPEDFSKKYFNTRSIQVTDNVENQDHLFRFLNSFDYLSELYLSCNSLDQSFYDSLGELSQLTDVTIKNSSPSISNFEFLLKLKLLKWFETDSDSANIFALTPALFSSLNYFRQIEFLSTKSERICIMRNAPNDYTMWFSDRTTLKLDFNCLILTMDAHTKELQSLNAFSFVIDGGVLSLDAKPSSREGIAVL